MLALLRIFHGVARELFRSPAALTAEYAMLRQRLIVAKRKVKERVQWSS